MKASMAAAKRVRDLRLHLGYETAASFARAIGYPPDNYGRYERVGLTLSKPMIRLVQAIEASGHGEVNLYWFLGFNSGPMFLPRQPQKRPLLRIVQ